MTIVCLGGVVLDQVFWIPELPTDSVKVLAHAFEVRGGGMAATAAVAIAALGGGTAFWGRVGDDPHGSEAIAQLTAAGVDVGNVLRCENAATAVSSVLVTDDGERLLVGFRGRGLSDDTAWLPLERLSHARAVLCDVRWPSGAKVLLKAAHEAGIPSVLDADVASDADLRELISLADHVLFSEMALLRFTEKADPAEALAVVAENSSAQIGVTLGSAGCGMWQDGSMIMVSGYDVEALDTNGAGDTYHGAYALAISEGRPPLLAAAFANAAGALKCALGRGWQGMPDRRSVDALMARQL